MGERVRVAGGSGEARSFSESGKGEARGLLARSLGCSVPAQAGCFGILCHVISEAKVQAHGSGPYCPPLSEGQHPKACWWEEKLSLHLAPVKLFLLSLPCQACSCGVLVGHTLGCGPPRLPLVHTTPALGGLPRAVLGIAIGHVCGSALGWNWQTHMCKPSLYHREDSTL